MKSKGNEELVYAFVLAGELEIDTEGRIWRVSERAWDRWNKVYVTVQNERRRAEHPSADYLNVRSMVDGRRVEALAHRLVWRHFNKQPIPENLTINHENGSKRDNRPENLTLATYKEQYKHSVEVLGNFKNRKRGEQLPGTKLTEEIVRSIRCRFAAGESSKVLAAEYGIHPMSVSRIARKERWTHVL